MVGHLFSKCAEKYAMQKCQLCEASSSFSQLKLTLCADINNSVASAGAVRSHSGSAKYASYVYFSLSFNVRRCEVYCVLAPFATSRRARRKLDKLHANMAAQTDKLTNREGVSSPPIGRGLDDPKQVESHKN